MQQFQATILPYGGTIHARQLLNYTPDELLVGLPRRLVIVFDDNTSLETIGKKAYYTSFFWQIYKTHPDTPLLQEHYVESALKGAPLNSSTHAALSEAIVRAVEKTYKLDTPEKREVLNRYVYQCACEDIHNNLSKAAETSVAPIDILDVIGLATNPTIVEAVNKTTAHADSINALYRVVDDVVKKDPTMRNNALVRAMQAKIVNFQQVCQSVAARGFPTEIDGKIFRVPITGNYLTGISQLYEFAADSCGARKALNNSEAPLQDAEYFARRLQFLAMVVERIAPGDCGTDKHMSWTIKPPQYDEAGAKVYSGDLEFMSGKYYLDETTGHYKIINGDDPSLYGKTLQIRSVLFCKHEDPHAVCEVCFGQLSRNVSRFANLGHLCAATMTQQTSQSVLSTKHLVVSGVGAPIILNAITSKFFTVTDKKTEYVLLPEYKKLDLRITIPRYDAIGLTDITNIDVDDVSPDRISSLTTINFRYQSEGRYFCDDVEIQQGSRRGIITPQFLKYLKSLYLLNNRWTLDEHNNFVFDMSGWDYSQPIFMLPQMEYSYSEHSHEIARTIESSMKNITDREKPDSPTVTLQQLFTLVNTKLNVNLAALEVIVYACMIPSKHDYSLARNCETPILGVAKKIISGRSLGVAYAYERHKDLITNPQSFLPHNRPNSVFDVFIDPKEVVREYQHHQQHQH